MGLTAAEEQFGADADGAACAQDKNIELQREVRWHEEQQLKEYERLEAVQLSARRGQDARSAERPAAAVHQNRAARTITVDPRQVPAGAQNRLGGHEDAASGTDSEEEGDDEELASYSTIHGLAQPWPSEQPGPSRQRRLWDAARDSSAADELATRSRGEGSAVRKDRASVSWDVLPSAADPAAAADDGDEQRSHEQHIGYIRDEDDRRDSGVTWSAARSDRHGDQSGRYSEPHHDAHAGTSTQSHGDLGPARSVSPSRAPSRQHAERAKPSIRRAWAPRSGALDDDMAGSQQQAAAAETHVHGKQHSASGERADGNSRAYWQRFAGDAAPQGSTGAACSSDHWDGAHSEHAGHGRMPANMPHAGGIEHAHGTTSGAAVRQANGLDSSRDARRKVRCVSV